MRWLSCETRRLQLVFLPTAAGIPPAVTAPAVAEVSPSPAPAVGFHVAGGGFFLRAGTGLLETAFHFVGRDHIAFQLIVGDVVELAVATS